MSSTLKQNEVPSHNQAEEFLNNPKPSIPQPQHPQFYAKYININEKSDTLYLATSHLSRIKDKILDSYLVYPGYVLSNPFHF